MKVGDEVKHKLMDWDGIIVLDLESNPLCSEKWKVIFKIDDKRESMNVYASEIK